MAGQLTETLIARAVREAGASGVRKELRDPAHRGLWLRVGKTGVRTWALRARAGDDKPHWFTLGHHPAMGLSEARAAATATLVAIRDGANPIADQRARRAAAASPPPAAVTDTLAAVLALYGEQRGCQLRSWMESRKRVALVFAALLPRSIQSLSAAELQIAADRYPSAQSGSFAVRTLRPALRWAAKRGYCPKTLAEIEQPAAVQRRQRVLSRAELAALLPALGAGPHGACLRFILLTASRLGEASGARWRDIDRQAATWTIPREQAKSDRAHVVPLSRQALAMLRRRAPADAPPDGLIFASRTGAPLRGWDRVGKRLQRISGVTGWHRHDLRRTAATLMGELGIDPHVIEAALGHVTVHSGLASIYNRSRYRPQVARALQLLGDALDGIEQGGAEVVSLASSA